MSLARMSFSYPEKMKNQLQKLADKDNRSLSSYVRTIFSDHIEAHGEAQSEAKEEIQVEKPKKKIRRSRKKTKGE